MAEANNLLDDRKRIRTKIANTVRRNNIDKKCFNCGKEGKILYDFNNPYNVVFICTDCKNDIDVLKEAEKHRLDIKAKIENDIGSPNSKLNLSSKQIKWLTDENIKLLVNNYMNSNMTSGNFCKSVGITRHQFNAIVNRYDIIYPNKNIKKEVKIKMNKVQKDLVIKMKSKKD